MARKVYDWKVVQVFHDEGRGFVECSRRFGFTHTAWIKAIQRKKLRVAPTAFPDRRRKYNWAEIQVYYDAGQSYRECRTKFKFCGIVDQCRASGRHQAASIRYADRRAAL